MVAKAERRNSCDLWLNESFHYGRNNIMNVLRIINKPCLAAKYLSRYDMVNVQRSALDESGYMP